MAARVHPTAIVEKDVTLGEGTSVWDNVHIRFGTNIGDECVIGEKTYIAYDVRIGSRVKINAFVYICTAVTIEDGVMVSAGTVFTNDRFPRATTPDLTQLRPSEPDDETLPTLVKAGATIGANCTIGNDLVIGRWAMVGMGSVVTRSVPDYALVLGNPARRVGAVCRCGHLLYRHAPDETPADGRHDCGKCGRAYEVETGNVGEGASGDARATSPPTPLSEAERGGSKQEPSPSFEANNSGPPLSASERGPGGEVARGLGSGLP